MSFKIDKKVPVPTSAKSNYQRWPFGKMEVGDSFIVKTERDKRTCVSAASYYGKRHGMKFSTRVMPNTDTYRIWRIA